MASFFPHFESCMLSGFSDTGSEAGGTSRTASMEGPVLVLPLLKSFFVLFYSYIAVQVVLDHLNKK